MAKLKFQQEWKLWGAVAVLILLVIGWLYFASRPPTEGGEPLWKVTQILDERSITVKGAGKTKKFTLIGIRIPQSQISASKEYLSKTLEDHWVRVKPLRDTDKDTQEGFIYLSGEDIVARMIRQGIAEVDRKETAFDVRPFIELEQEAEREGRGFWRKSDSGAK